MSRPGEAAILFRSSRGVNLRGGRSLFRFPRVHMCCCHVSYRSTTRPLLLLLLLPFLLLLSCSVCSSFSSSSCNFLFLSKKFKYPNSISLVNWCVCVCVCMCFCFFILCSVRVFFFWPLNSFQFILVLNVSPDLGWSSLNLQVKFAWSTAHIICVSINIQWSGFFMNIHRI